MLVIALVAMTGCAIDDNPVNPENPLNKNVLGNWYGEYESVVSVPIDDGNLEISVKMIQFYQFNEDGTGYWASFALGESGSVMEHDGGLTGGKDAEGYFRYTAGSDGTVNIRLVNLPKDDESVTWTLHIDDGKLTETEDGITFVFSHPTEGQLALIEKMDAQINGGNNDDEETWKWGDFVDDSDWEWDGYGAQ